MDNSLTRFRLDRPILILSSDEREIGEEELSSPERWLDVVEAAAPSLAGVVLPLELKISGHARSQLKGIELLRWLRWSGKDRVRLFPVLATAWQPLEEILRLVPELLLVGPGTRFVRLPDLLEGKPSVVECFIQQVRNEPEKWCAREGDLNRLAVSGTEDVRQLSHHDLANEGYAAWRLWVGYLRALEDAGGKRGPRQLRDRLDWARTVSFEWQPELLRRQRQPAFQQFQIARRGSAPPKYPTVPGGLQIVLHHTTNGLPPRMRILMVDDEYDKGIGCVLLKILFGDVNFTSKGPKGQEWVYSEGQAEGWWSRLVLVKNTAAAYNWLAHWGEFETNTDDAVKETSYREWLRGWASALREDTTWEDVNGNDAEQMAHFSKSAEPSEPITVILLDLRLDKKEPEVSYDPAAFASLQFRAAVKRARPEIPFVLITASRQALNYEAATLPVAPPARKERKDKTTAVGERIRGPVQQFRPPDGWLTKEAPDVPIDDANSSHAVQYLLERLHLFNVMPEWCRPELGWDSTQIAAFNLLWNRPDRDALIASVASTAKRLFDEAKQGQRTAFKKGIRFIGFINSQLGTPPCKVIPRLVARKVAVACLLYTADWTKDIPMWNVTKFWHILPQERDKGTTSAMERNEGALSDVVNFNEALWLPGSDTGLNWLLREEYEWLLSLDWADEPKQYIFACLRTAYPSTP